MKIGLLSDSHGNIAFIKKAGQYLKEKARVDLIVHLGDECDDIDALDGIGIEIIKIPGLFSSCYHDPAVPNRIIKDIAGIKILMTHCSSPHANDLAIDKDPQTLIAENGIKAVFYGHTHIQKAEVKDGVVWINPGHMRESKDKGNFASFAVVEIKGAELLVDIIELTSLALKAHSTFHIS